MSLLVKWCDSKSRVVVGLNGIRPVKYSVQHSVKVSPPFLYNLTLLPPLKGQGVLPQLVQSLVCTV